MKKNFLLLFAIPAALCAQTIINGSRIIKGSLDASGSTRSLPNRTGTGSPTGRDNCTNPGETYFQTDAMPGQNLWVCTAAGMPGTWNQISGAGESSGNSVVTGTTSPNGSCSAGSFYLRTDIQELYVCSGTNVWELASYASGNTGSRPLGCVSGQLYVATDTGDLWYCAVAGSLGTWQSVTPLTNVSLNGTPQGAFSTLNLVNAPGANWNLTSNGQTLNISPALPVSQTTVVPSGNSVTFTRATNIQEFILTLTGNVTTSSTSGFTAGDIYYFEICQNSTGGFTLAWPSSGFAQAPTVDLAPNVCTKFHGTWDTSGNLQVAGVPTTTESPFLISQAHERPAPSTPAVSFEALWPDQTRNTWVGLNSAGNTHIMPRSTHSGADQLYSSDLADYATMNAAGLQNAPSTCSIGFAPTGVDAHGNALNCTQISGGGSMVYPSAGVPNSSGSAWGASYQIGTAANNLVQLNSSGALPAVSGVNLTNLPAATALNLSATPAQCSGGQVPTGITVTGAANGCFTPSGGGGGGSPGGISGQIQYNNGGSFGGFTASGDATISTSTGAVTVTKTSGTAFAPSATIDTTNASNISSGTLGAARLPNTVVQTNQSNTFTAGTQDSHSATHTLPVATGSGAPTGSCTVGEMYFNTGATAGQNLYFCTGSNTWTQMSGGGSSPVTDTVYIPFGSQYSTNNASANEPTGGGVGRDTGNSPSTTPYLSGGVGYAYPGYLFAQDITKIDYIYATSMLPSNWTGTLNVTLVGLAGSSTGNAALQVATSCPTPTSAVEPPTYNTASTGTMSLPTASRMNTLSLTSVNVTGCSSNSILIVQVGRNAQSGSGDTITGNMYLLGMQLQWQHN